MKYSTLVVVVPAFLASNADAFSPANGKNAAAVKTTSAKYDAAVPTVDGNKPIFDPLGLYPRDAPEREAGLIQPLEMAVEPKRALLDPLGLYEKQASSPSDATTRTLDERSASLPFLSRPLHLDGSMAGDRGFDPLGLAANPDNLLKLRNSELKHARLAMLAAAGWPLAELFHPNIAHAWHLPNALNLHDRVPSVLNGGLGNVSPIFWVAALAAAATVEAFSGAAGEIQSADLGFDPLNLSKKGGSSKRFLQESELFNGRLAMLAITGFAMQEFVTGNSVVDAIPIFFKPFNVVMEQLLASGAATSL